MKNISNENMIHWTNKISNNLHEQPTKLSIKSCVLNITLGTLIQNVVI